MSYPKMMILVAGLIGVSAAPAAGQAGASIIATATVIDMSLARATYQAANSLGSQVALGRSRLAHAAGLPGASVRQDMGAATIFAGDVRRKEAIEGSHAPMVTITYW
ncbi:MAG: hypothetical protein ACREMY_13750 [bacterium]